MEQEQASSITSFKTAGEYFGIETMKIQHILENLKPTPVPLTAEYILGIINNHGNMFPVVDFRQLIGAEADDNQPEASIIVVSVDGTNETLIGFKVDEVDEVFDITKEKVTKDVVLEVDNKGVQASLSGTISRDGKFIYTVNIDELSKVI